MRKSHVSTLAVAFGVMCMLSLPAAAISIVVQLDADCDGYVITGEARSGDWSVHTGGKVVYELTLTQNGGTTATASGEQVIEGTENGWLPFGFSGSWGVEICGDVVVEGSVHWVYKDGSLGDVVSLGPIALTCPCDGGGDGCTPGFWKNHMEAWAATGYTSADDFDTTFGVDLFDPNITLGQAIRLGGGGVKKLARHGTAALLSAAHGGVDYPYTVAEVIALVQAGDADALVWANELGCPLRNNGGGHRRR